MSKRGRNTFIHNNSARELAARSLRLRAARLFKLRGRVARCSASTNHLAFGAFAEVIGRAFLRSTSRKAELQDEHSYETI
jgi:hypothetical protein